VAPTDEDLYDLAEVFNGEPVAAMRRALELWGTPTIQPVPVSERLPGAEDCDAEGAADCDAEGRCWWFVLEDEEQPSAWYLDGQPPAREIRFYGNTHWLPHHALPTP
jgi:hypothetical protein